MDFRTEMKIFMLVAVGGIGYLAATFLYVFLTELLK